MLKKFLNNQESNKLSKEEMKAITGGLGPGRCTEDSMIICTNNVEICPRGQGCYLELSGTAYCRCYIETQPLA